MAEETTQQSQDRPAAANLEHLLSENPLQADDAGTDEASLSNYSEASDSHLSSLKSSIMNYRWNGRRYHAFREGAYLVPNDDEEQERMDLGHHIYSLALKGKLYLAPVGDKIQRVLDLGTGTGIWAIDFADLHPSAEVLGTDLSPIQPKWVPPNCVFEVDDFESEWLFHKPFDFIHARELGGCISNDEVLFQRAFKHLNPGGFIEFQAVYPSLRSDDDNADKATNAQYWIKTICEATAKFGKPLDGASKWKDKLQAAGFVDVQQEIRKIPIGAWPKDPEMKEIGRYQSIQELQVVDSYTPAVFSRVLGWSNEEIQVFIAKVKNDMKDPSIHLYLPVYLVWGRKP
ncbi:S-adenosyl-L-methionine-dependent methyltransferase [Thelonectria olida]|uniref:S-adenosyl-L-methionine-dependent methyltransferase n=1 Tax=Thelonectria olida TaxID=1576542 RepID=A0A9P9AQ22_9HYPO|nr:S-adenosyl-L-methionine-dependent methyltransferase [Thelonectria olida]